MSKFNSVPLYIQVKENILAQIKNEELQPGDILPAEIVLQEKYNVSRTTIRNALKELEYEGHLIRKAGKGTFIAHRKINPTPRKLMSYTEEMKSYGLKPYNKVISLIKEIPSQDIRNKLNILDNQYVWRIERIKYADNETMALDLSYIPVKVSPDLSVDILENKSLFDHFINDLKLQIKGASENLYSRNPTAAEEKLLKIKRNVPLFIIERITYAGDNHIPIEFVITSFRSDRYMYKVTL